MARFAYWLLLLLAIVPASATYRSRSDPNPALVLSTYAAGASAAHKLSFDVNAGDLEIYRATVTYGEGFRSNGFGVQGQAGSPVGSYHLDVDFDDVPEVVMPIRSITTKTAYVDIIPDDLFSPDLEPALDVGVDATLQLRLPFGGDANSETLVAPLGARVTLVLYPNIIVNPELGGDYSAVARFVTVDPDTDGANDGAGAAPESIRAAVSLHINGPVLVEFSKLRIDDFDLKTHGSKRDRFTMSGRYVLGTTSDGINVIRDRVTVTFASFAQTIPANAFTGNRHLREYRGDGPGVHRLTLRSDGRFDLDVRELHLILPDQRQTFSLAIGNDVGEAVVIVPKKRRDDHDRDRDDDDDRDPSRDRSHDRKR